MVKEEVQNVWVVFLALPKSKLHLKSNISNVSNKNTNYKIYLEQLKIYHY